MENLTEKELEKLLEQKRKNKNKARFSKFIVSSIIILNILFTLGVLYVFLRIGNEPMTLVTAWFGFTTVELWSLAKIKREKIKEETNGYRDNY